jgi:hypothetical protein
MFDMLQLVGEVGKKRLLRMQEQRHLSLRKVSIPHLDDKLKFVGHSGLMGRLDYHALTIRKRPHFQPNASVSLRCLFFN